MKWWLTIKFASISMLFTPPILAYTLLSGPKESRLSVSYLSPQVTFYWNSVAPLINDLSDFPQWQELSDHQVMRNILQLALDTWSLVHGSYIRLNLQEDPEMTLNRYDNHLAIVVADDNNVTTAASAFPQVKDDTIIDCDIKIVDREISAHRLAYTLIHELGHCLGLGHNHTNYGAIMSYSRAQSSLALGDDDRAGIMFLYPDPKYTTSSEQFRCGALPFALLTGNKPSRQQNMLTIFILLIPLIFMGIVNVFYPKLIK